MRLRSLILAVVVLLVAFVVGGNLYIRGQVKKTFYSQLDQWEKKVNRGLPPGQKIKVEVKEIQPSFSPLPFISPSNFFVVKGVSLLSPTGDATLQRLVGTAETSFGKVKAIKLAALEGLEVKDKKGFMKMDVRRIIFTPALDVSRFLGWMKEPIKETGGKAEGITLSFIGKKGGDLEISVKEASFRQKVDLGKKGEVPPEQPIKAHSLLKDLKVKYSELGDEKAKGEARFSYLDLEYSLARDENGSGYTFWEGVKTELTQLKVTLPPGKAKRETHLDKLLPLKGGFRLELVNLSQDLVSSLLDLMRTLRDESLPRQQRLALFLQFVQKALPGFVSSTIKGSAQLEFPQGSALSAQLQVGVMGLMNMKKTGNPVWLVVKVKDRDKLLSLLSQAGIQDPKVQEFLQGLQCQGNVCEKRVPLGGRGRQKF